MQRLEVSGAVRPIYGSLGVKRLTVSLSLPSLERRFAVSQISALPIRPIYNSQAGTE